jgi:muramidase (phage lysozyme)
MSPNLKAFLDTIAYSEIGPALLAASDNGYNVLVGSTPKQPLLFGSYVTHPRVYNRAVDSDAAGRYQFLGRYWPAYKQQLSLPDFAPASQDRWAVQLVKECHALDDVELGHVDVAIRKCASRWASFPGAGYGQHENELQTLITAFHACGGTLAAGLHF